MLYFNFENMSNINLMVLKQFIHFYRFKKLSIVKLIFLYETLHYLNSQFFIKKIVDYFNTSISFRSSLNGNNIFSLPRRILVLLF